MALGSITAMLKVLEATATPTLSSVLPMFGVLASGLNDTANAVAVIDDEVHRVKVCCINFVLITHFVLALILVI